MVTPKSWRYTSSWGTRIGELWGMGLNLTLLHNSSVYHGCAGRVESLVQLSRKTRLPSSPLLSSRHRGPALEAASP
jgi:hypothetical protein